MPFVAQLLLNMPGSNLTMQVVTSCISHKPRRSVKFRNIHSAPCHSFAGLAIWSANQHRIKTSRIKNWDKDTRDSIQQISERKASLEHYFVRLDIGKFIMSDESEFLAVDAVSLSDEGPRKRLIHDVDRFFLEYQFVTTNRHPDKLWHVKKGSGMGMKNSGELSDAVSKLVESWFLLLEVVSAFSSDLCGRFKDDIHIVDRDRKAHETLRVGHEATKQTQQTRSGGTFGSYREVP